MSSNSETNQIKASVPTPPLEIVQAAAKVETWFKELNITDWQLGGCASRILLDQISKSYDDVLKKYLKIIGITTDWVTWEISEQEKMELDQENLKALRTQMSVRKQDGISILKICANMETKSVN